MGIWFFSQLFKGPVASSRRYDRATPGKREAKQDQPPNTAGADIVVNRLLIASRARAALVIAILIVSFAVFYQMLQPSNFDAFSDMSAFFISGLAALLAIVISFNSFTLKNETSSMSSEIKRIDEELERMEDLLKPLKPEAGTTGGFVFNSTARYATEAVHYMMKTTLSMAEGLVVRDKLTKGSETGSICLDFIAKSKYYLSLFQRTNNIYSLAIMPTTDFIIRMRFKAVTSADAGQDAKHWYEVLKRLHVLRNIASTVFVRSSIASLSHEILFSTIPVIFLMAAVSFAFSHEEYGPAVVRAIFAGSLSTATLPFILLAVRTIPMVHLAKNNSGLPFSHK